MRNRPAVKVIILYITGIILADRLYLRLSVFWILSAILVINAIIAYKRRWLSINSSFIFVLIILAGALRYEISMVPPAGLYNVAYQEVEVRGVVIESKEERSGGSSLIVEGEAVSKSDPSCFMMGKISVRSWEEIFPQVYGDVVEIQGELSRPRRPHNPGTFDYRKFMARRGIFATMTIDDLSQVQVVGSAGNSSVKWIRGLRGRAEGTIDSSMPPESASILKGIILGDRSALSDEVYEMFLRTSTSHVLAVSGLHIGILSGWIFLLCNWIRRLIKIESKKWSYIPMLPVIILYACIVGFRISVVRASIFAALVIMASVIDRDEDLFNTLAIAALGILIYHPGAIFDAAFQLSFGSVVSILYLMPYWERFLVRFKGYKWHQRILYRVLQGIAVSLSAQIGAILIIAHIFKRISITGAIVNPVVVPLVGIIVPIGFVQCILTQISKILGEINHVLISIMRYFISYFAGFQFSQLTVRGFSFWHLISFAAAIIFTANLYKLLKHRKKLIIYSLGVFSIFVWAAALSYEGNVMEVTYLDVSQGDSIFIDLPNGKYILIDGGPYSGRFDTGKSVVAPFLEYKGVDKLDFIISTHPHNDHAGGLTYTVDNFSVNEVITGSYGLTTPTFEELLKRLNKRGIKYYDAQEGTIMKDGDIELEILGPSSFDLSGDEDSRMNNNSVVLKVKYKDASFLFTGDIHEETEYKLIDSGKDLKATILKVPHQGSKTSSSWEFLRAVQPTVGIISVGWMNMYNHPSPSITGRYKWLGINTYRTDRQWAIIVTTDGRRGWIKTMSGY
jgi:competence protein ComEC